MDFISKNFKNYKISLPYVFVDYILAKDYFKDYIKNRTLRSDVFEYILDNDFSDYIELYRSWGKPNQIQNVEMHAKDENLENDPDIDK